ncbi:hypothetical protein [Streptomyces sp. NPDC046385]
MRRIASCSRDTTVPVQGAGPSPEEVAAAIRADPEVARAAAAALAAGA